MGLIISGSFDQKKKKKKKTTVTVLHSDRKEWFLSACVGVCGLHAFDHRAAGGRFSLLKFGV